MSYEQTFDDNDFDAPEALSPDANADEQQHAGTNGNHSSASGHAAAAGSDGYGQPAASWELRHHRDQDTAAAAGTGSGTAGAHGAGNGSAADAAGNGRGASYKTEPGTSSSRPPAASGSGSAGSKDIQLFAGSLTNATTDAMLRDYFKTFGTIIDCRVGRTRDGRSRGFAFLSVADESTSAAILGQAHIIDGKQVCLRRALSSEEEAKTGRIFIGGLPPEATEEDVIKACSEYGAVHSADIIRDQETKESRKFALTLPTPRARPSRAGPLVRRPTLRNLTLATAEPIVSLTGTVTTATVDAPTALTAMIVMTGTTVLTAWPSGLASLPLTALDAAIATASAAVSETATTRVMTVDGVALIRVTTAATTCVAWTTATTTVVPMTVTAARAAPVAVVT
ncbi:hypothetical protein BC831DRAFT_209003 [Entophlyctis helioformis]|nr:hypothetical protein BC831DRAFT_209003 [Entophlyctis helioformis]